ncbi:MarR family winged helix-turn-helix transcriptional regulator [Neobacillus terrae]|uniref:MarR family winged helix-turn-helix transcriptional regulator n=1 Tax=Neobacillus terrae TaxID=3034837 RepID=UPI00140780D6|nr:MarR family transcriptional regulator [Neobacillus terrae]NHM31098.1 MarR family transcriptional regulator [Neobacillus terrae]
MNQNRELYNLVRDVYHLLQRGLDKELESLNISFVQFGVIQVLSRLGKATMTELIEEIGCAPSNMTTMIQRLKRDGYVQKEIHPSDQRISLVCLTEKGEQIKDQFNSQYEEYLRKIFGFLGNEERTKLQMQLGYIKNQLNSFSGTKT